MTVRAAEVPVGFEVPPFARKITREMGVLHASPLKNFHTDLEEARAMGFADIVIAGPMFTCFFSEMFTRFFGGDWITAGEMEFKLVKPVLANETITARAVVTSHEPRGEHTRVALEIWCEREEDGARTSTGSASVLVRA